MPTTPRAPVAPAPPTPPGGNRPEAPRADTPLRRQYQQLKAQHPRRVLLFQLGDFFEAFEDDARTVAASCGVALTSRELGKGDRVLLAGVPLARLDTYLARLLHAGHHVAIAEQVSQPGSGLVERVITRVVTPGTLVEPGLLRERENVYLAACIRAPRGVGLAYVDVSTGEFRATQFAGEDADTRLQAELERLRPAELLLPEDDQPPRGPARAYTPCPAWRFGETDAQERVLSLFGVRSLEAFGCADKPLALGAAGAILAYLEETDRRFLRSVSGLTTYTAGRGMALDSATTRNLELFRGGRTGRLDGSLLGTIDRTATPMGGRLLRARIGEPLLDPAEIDRRLDDVEALVRDDDLRGALRALLATTGDLERRVGRVAREVATPRELLDLAASLRAGAEVRRALEHAPAPLAAFHDRVEGRLDLAASIEQAVAPPGSGRSIRPGYSPELDALVRSISSGRRELALLEQRERQRTGIKSLKVGFNRVFGYYLEVTLPNLPLVPPEYQRKQTLVSAERFVTPTLKEHEQRILRAEEQIDALERETFLALLRQVADHAPALRDLAHTLARLDVAASLAELAREGGYCRPTLDHSETLRITDGRHPVVEARMERGSFIPNDCLLDRVEQQVMILTGPNMAGKSTYLRQAALIVLLAQIGSFVPARSAHLGVVDRVFTRVGAQDDIASGASTFMVEMSEAASILRHASRRSLVILDEIGRGTSTYDGLSLARAIVEDVQQRIGARTLFATHFHELSALAGELPRVSAFHTAVAEEGNRVVFLRKILPGGADRSYGIHVARLAGLPSDVTTRAEQILSSLERAAVITHDPATIVPGRLDAAVRPAAHGPVGGPLGLPPAASACPSSPSRLPGEAEGGAPAGNAAPSAERAQREGPACHTLSNPPWLLEALLSIDLANTTPLQALTLLADLQRRARR